MPAHPVDVFRDCPLDSYPITILVFSPLVLKLPLAINFPYKVVDIGNRYTSGDEREKKNEDYAWYKA